jgi:phosphoribosyl 1,2-cyclic phosphodiesterase
MKIKIWGCRGSLPVPGPDTLKYGGNTTCVALRLSGGEFVIFDAGTGIRNLGFNLMGGVGNRDIYLILTHAHWDHLMGFPFFAPAYSDKFTIHIRGGPIAKETLKKYFEHQMEAPYFPARMEAMKAKMDITHGFPLVKNIGYAIVTPIQLSHPNGGFGFKIEEEKKTLVFLTDNELDYQHKNGKSYTEYVSFCRDADMLIHDAQYSDEEYSRFRMWGHSTYNTVIDLASDARVKRLMLFHHDPARTDKNLDQLGLKCQEIVQNRKGKFNFSIAKEGREIVL